MKTIILWMMMVALAVGAPTKLVELSTLSDWKGGKSDGVALTDEGVLQRGVALEKVVGLEARIVWSALADSKGAIYAATTGPSALWRIEGGRAQKLGGVDARLLRALSVDAKGRLFAGADDGVVFLAEKSEVKKFAKLEAKYLWALREEKGKLLAGSGLPGALWEIDMDGAASKLLGLPQNHLTAILKTKEGYYLGAGEPATVYFWDGKGKARVVFQATEPEVRALAHKDGELYVLTYGMGNMPATQKPEAKAEEVVGVPSGMSALYRIDAGGVSRKIWNGAGDGLLAMEVLDGRLLLGGEKDGRLWSCDRDGRATLFGQVKAGGDIVAIVKDKDGIAVVTNKPAAVERQKKTSKAVFESDVVKFGQGVIFGALEAKSEGVRWETRSGYTDKPDDYWSDWVGLKDGKIASPSGSRLQLRASLEKNEANIERVRVFYASAQEPIVIEKIRALPYGVSVQKAESNPPAPLALDELLRGKVDEPGKGMNYLLLPEMGRGGNMTLVWKAFDPMGRDLEYDVAIKPEGGENWLTLGSQREDPVYVFDTGKMPEGYYRAKVLAQAWDGSRRVSTEKISESFVVDASPPAIEGLETSWEGSVLRVKARLADKWSRIVGGRLTIDGRKSVEMEAADGLWDSNNELAQAAIDLTGWDAQQLTVRVEADDENGNASSLTTAVKR